LAERTGQAAVVVGGTGALGRAIALRLAAEGADVAFTYRSNAKGAQALAGEMDRLGVRSLGMAVAIENPAAVESYVAQVIGTFGRLDTLVYASGPTFSLEFVAGVSFEEWSRVMDADVKGCFNIVRAALSHLRDTRGSIVAVVTGGVNKAIARDVLSIAPKAAVQSLIRAVALEEGRFGVRANCLAPGFIAGGLGASIMDAVGPDQAKAMLKAVPMRRTGTVDEIADAAAYLSSARASYVTGNTLFVTGGMEL